MRSCRYCWIGRGLCCIRWQRELWLSPQMRRLFLKVEEEKQDADENDCCQQKTKKWTAAADRSDRRSAVKVGAGKRSGDGIAGFEGPGSCLASLKKAGQEVIAI